MTRTATISITPRATLSAVSDEASPRWRILFQAIVARFTRGFPLESVPFGVLACPLSLVFGGEGLGEGGFSSGFTSQSASYCEV